MKPVCQIFFVSGYEGPNKPLFLTSMMCMQKHHYHYWLKMNTTDGWRVCKRCGTQQAFYGGEE